MLDCDADVTSVVVAPLHTVTRDSPAVREVYVITVRKLPDFRGFDGATIFFVATVAVRVRDLFAGGQTIRLARAPYLYRDGRDTLFRLHGTNEPWLIGQAVSNGCIRLTNEDIVDLYDRTPLGSAVVII